MLTNAVSWQLLVAMLLNGVVQALGIAAYAARLAGALTGRAATAMSLYNVFVTTSRFASMLYTPMLGVLSDRTTPATLHVFQWQLRAIIIAGMIGAIVGTVLIPTFVHIYIRAINSLDRHGSIPKIIARLFISRVSRSAPERPSMNLRLFHQPLPIRRVPKDVLVLNFLVTAMYAVGIVSAAYASVIAPATARTSLLSMGLVTGLATIAYNLVVDPASALLTDRAARGECDVDEVRALVAGLAVTAILGFLLSQLLLVPAAYVIAWGAHLINGR